MDTPAPYELVDIHNHLLPGVDDGAHDLEESVRFLQDMAAEGVVRLATSPHLNGYLLAAGGFAERLDELATTFHRFREAASERGGLPALEFGQELLLPDSANLVPEIVRDPRVGMAGTRFVLVEFGYELRLDPQELIRALDRAGRRAVVAHPERYRRDDTAVSTGELREWRAEGALLQVNAASLLGGYGPDAGRIAWELVTTGMADLVASDHHAAGGPVSLREAVRALLAAGGLEQTRRLTSENPARILDGREPLDVPPLIGRTAA